MSGAFTASRWLVHSSSWPGDEAQVRGLGGARTRLASIRKAALPHKAPPCRRLPLANHRVHVPAAAHGAHHGLEEPSRAECTMK